MSQNHAKMLWKPRAKKFLKKTFWKRKILNKEHREKICILKKIKLLQIDFVVDWFSQFFNFCIFYAKLKFSVWDVKCRFPPNLKEWWILAQDAFVFEITVSFIVFVSDKFSVNHLTLQKDNEHIYPFNPNPGGRQIAWKRWGGGLIQPPLQIRI